jgi:hypothetical protein
MNEQVYASAARIVSDGRASLQAAGGSGGLGSGGAAGDRRER